MKGFALILAGVFQAVLLWILVVSTFNVLNPCATEFDLPLPPGCSSGPVRSANQLALVLFIPIWFAGTLLTIAIWRLWRRANASEVPSES